jgi:hypothetical protein
MNEQKSAGYGHLWLIPRAGVWKMLGMDEAAGFGGQRIAIWPKAGLVLVHRAETIAEQKQHDGSRPNDWLPLFTSQTGYCN